jgi:hypothetical protein
LRIPLLWAMLVFMLFGQLGVLQSFAWARMLMDYSRTNTIKRAVTMTFDGNHPCAMCQKIAQVRQQEQPKDLPLKGEMTKAPDFNLWEGVLLSDNAGRPNSYPLPTLTHLKTWTDSPPSPVPLA